MYELLKTQKEFIDIPHDHSLDVCVYQGGYGSGKTFVGSLLGILLCLGHAGIRGLVGAQTHRLVSDTTLVSYLEHLDKMGFVSGKDYIFAKSESKLSFSNGSEVLFRHFEEPDKLKSLNLGFVEIEEMSDVPEATYHMLLGRLRQAGVPRYRLFGHTNPESSKGWIYKNFIESPKPNYRFIQAPTTENIFLPEGYVESLKAAYDSDYFNINVLGNFGNYTKGLVTKGFSDKDNIKELKYLDFVPLHISCDFNVDPMSWVIAHKDEKNVYFIDEIVIENTTTAECIDEFIKRYPNHKGGIVINGDASGDNRTTSSEWTNYVIMRNRLRQAGYNVEVKIKTKNPHIESRIAAWNSKIKNTKGDIGVYISPKCKWLLYNIHNLKYKEGSTLLDLPTHHQIKQSRESKYLGHIYDAASYLVEYYFPIKSDIIKNNIKKPKDVWEKYAS